MWLLVNLWRNFLIDAYFDWVGGERKKVIWFVVNLAEVRNETFLVKSSSGPSFLRGDCRGASVPAGVRDLFCQKAAPPTLVYSL